MKKILFMAVAFLALTLTACGGVNYEKLNKKCEAAIENFPEETALNDFSASDYKAMAEYCKDADKCTDFEQLDKDYPYTFTFALILAAAEEAGVLPADVKKQFEESKEVEEAETELLETFEECVEGCDTDAVCVEAVAIEE